ncbi:MAG: hypothetical protein DME54_11930 [Verrucomicrobia bacterium]|nr:MAG: hypothetical protein DMF09_07760 [Verrucomicrobiota bacterium]PYK33515.1 MAG: hypothetical protein DME54_11930 [Verrucomicrobiota bacterium]
MWISRAAYAKFQTKGAEAIRNRLVDVWSSASPNTAHTSSLVHFIYVAKNAAQFRCKDGILADVAPTLLFLLGFPQPKEMTGHHLLVRV